MKKIIIALILAFSLVSCGADKSENKPINEIKKENIKNEKEVLYDRLGKGKYQKFLSIDSGIISAKLVDNIEYLDLNGNKLVNNISINGIKFEEFGKSLKKLGKITLENKINFINNKGKVLFGEINDISTWGEKIDFSKNVFIFKSKRGKDKYNIIDDGKKLLEENFLMRRAGGVFYLLRETQKYPKNYIYNLKVKSLHYIGKGEIYLRMNQDYLLYFSQSEGKLIGIDNNGNEKIFLGKDIIQKYDFFQILNFKKVTSFLSYIFRNNSIQDGSNNVNYSFLSKIESNKVVLSGYEKNNIYDILEKKFIFNNFNKYKIYSKKTNEFGRDYNINRLIPLKLKIDYASESDFGTYPLYIDEDIGENEPYLKSQITYAHPEEDMEIFFIKQYYRDLENGKYEDIWEKTSWEKGRKSFKQFVGWYKGLEEVKIINIKPLGEHKYKIELNLFYKGKTKAEYISITKKIKKEYGKTFLETLN